MAGTLDQIGNVFFVFGRERRDNFLLVLEVAIDQSDANPGLGTDIVHAGLVKAVLCEAEHGRLEDLLSAIKNCAGAFRGHWKGTMNERSFIVKSRIVPEQGDPSPACVFCEPLSRPDVLLTESKGGVHNLVFLGLTRPQHIESARGES